MILHANLVALRLGGLWRGALITGPSGVGKSDLTMRALEAGLRLVADDRVIVWASGGALFGRAPDPLAGLIEVRGQGVVCVTPVALAQIVGQLQCVSADEVERLPEPVTETIGGIAIASLRVDPKEASAPAKLRRAIEYLGVGRQQAYLGALRDGGGRGGSGDSR